MAKFNSPTSVFNSELSIFNKEFLGSSTSLTFSIAQAILSQTAPISVTLELNFTDSSLLSGGAYMDTEFLLTFLTENVASATGIMSSDTGISFNLDGNMKRATYLSAETDISFVEKSILYARAYMFSETLVEFSSDKIRLDAFAGRAVGMYSSFTFDTEFKLRNSPWQGLSEIGGAIYREGEFSSNYGKSPFGKEVGR